MPGYEEDMTEDELRALYPHRCGLCSAQVAVLVDDGTLCIRCDSFVYPELRPAS